MSRLLQIVFVTTEEAVGGILADLSGRAKAFEVHVVEQVPFHKNRPRRKAARKVGKLGVPQVGRRATRKQHNRKAKVKAKKRGGTRDIVMSYLLKHQQVTGKTLKQLFEVRGLSATSVPQTLTSMVKDQSLVRVAPGVYESSVRP